MPVAQTTAKPNLEWVYGAYDINANLALQAGRKRLPLLFYSESQDIGMAYPCGASAATGFMAGRWSTTTANLFYRDQWGGGRAA